MRSKVEIESDRPEKVGKVLRPSLNTDKTVSYRIQEEKGNLEIRIETDGIGPLRGCTDTVFRLSSLALKLY